MSKKTKQIKIVNTSENVLAFSHVPQFASNEERLVDADIAEKLLQHPDMQEVKSKASEKDVETSEGK